MIYFFHLVFLEHEVSSSYYALQGQFNTSSGTDPKLNEVKERLTSADSGLNVAKCHRI